MGKHKKHGRRHSSSSSSSSSSSCSSDEEWKHLPKHERKMRKKMKKQMKKGKIPHGMVYPGGHGGKHHGGTHGYPHAGGVPSYPAGGAPGYPATGAPGYPAAGAPGYPAGAPSYPTAGAPAYPAPGAPSNYPAGNVPPPAGYSAGGFAPPPGGAGYPAPPQPSYPGAPPAGGYPSGQPSQPSYQDYGGQGAGGFTAPPAAGATPASGGFVAPAQGQYGGQPPQAQYPEQQPGQYGGQPVQGQYPGQQPGQPPQQYGGQPAHQGQGGGYGSGVATATAGMGKLNVQANPADIPRPTVRPANPFSPDKDAEILRKAMKGIVLPKDGATTAKSLTQTVPPFDKLLQNDILQRQPKTSERSRVMYEKKGTDERAIIDVVSNRTNQQRQQILVMFKTMYGKDLIADLKSELSGDLEELIMALFKPTTFYDAWSLHRAMTGVGTKESVLIEILCTRTNAEVKEIVASYRQHYKRELEKDIMDETSGHFKRLLVSCCQGARMELTAQQQQVLAQQGPNAVVDCAMAQEDAQKLYQAGAKKIGTDESAFLSVMALRNQYQLRATFDEYQKISGKDILSSIGSEMSGDLEDGFKALVMSARNRPRYFADRLHRAMAGFGTKDSLLIRVIVSRSEIDLQNIKEEYQQAYGKPLRTAVASETSGDYEKLLLGIIGQ